MKWRTWNDSSLPPLLFLHGFLGESLDWEEIVTHFPEFYCVAPDLPGHGQSDITDATTLENTVDAIINEISQFTPQPIVVVGYSMGGRIGVRLCLSAPRRFKGVVLESAHLGIENPIERRARLYFDQQLSKKLLTMDPVTFLNEWCSLPMFGNLNQHPEFSRLILRRSQYDRRRVAIALNAFSIVTQPSLWDQISTLPIVGYITGELDTKYRDVGQRIQNTSTIPVRVLPHLGHNCHFEDPVQFSMGVREYIRFT